MDINKPSLHRLGLPLYGWKVRLDHQFEEKRTPLSSASFRQLVEFIPAGFRYAKLYYKLWKLDRKPFIDQLLPLKLEQIYGVPLGGIGCGAINRGWKGDFCRWSLTPGMYTFDIVEVNQFTVCIQKKGTTVYQQVLSPSRPTTLSHWNWAFSAEHALYQGLYPRAWTVYELPGQNVTLVCRQVSPLFPNDYKDTSLPVGLFVWEVHNRGRDPIDVTIMMTWKNGTGGPSDRNGGRWNEPFISEDHRVSGVLLHNAHPKMKCTMAIAASATENVSVSHFTAFNPEGDGKDVWEDLIYSGKLRSNKGASAITGKGESIATAVAATCTVAADSKSAEPMEFALSWHMPDIHFRANEKVYKRRYARWFSSVETEAARLCSHALGNYRDWERKIEDWQNPILDNDKLPAWYKSALFNELYFITDGGTVWVDEPNLPDDAPQTSKDYGKFIYLEGHEYRMFNTYDVHFYASFALVMLWPKIQLSLQYDIGKSILETDAGHLKELYSGKKIKRKFPNVVPHDVGDPEDEPWVRVNAYCLHDTSDWKDLNPKFVLQVYRDYCVTGDMQYLQDMWDKVKAVMVTSMSHDKDGDGIIDNSGYADQTYDVWAVTGASAYCGGLWLGALRCAVQMAETLGHQEEERTYRAVLDKAKLSYEAKLWNGKYYNYDSSTKYYSNSIMSDQLAGHWYLGSCGLTSDPNDLVFPREHVRSALATIFEVNVMSFHGGLMGAVNGMRPDGKVDDFSFQGEEIWTGVNYALAATMIQEGMAEEGFRTASGVYKTCYEKLGFGYNTPEAYFAKKNYRSLGYMRPLSIWAMQFALEKQVGNK